MIIRWSRCCSGRIGRAGRKWVGKNGQRHQRTAVGRVRLRGCHSGFSVEVVKDLQVLCGTGKQRDLPEAVDPEQATAVVITAVIAAAVIAAAVIAAAVIAAPGLGSAASDTDGEQVCGIRESRRGVAAINVIL